MANKRVELQQCKYFVDLQQEYPTRKKAGSGLLMVFILAIFLLVAFLIYGFASNQRAKEPTNLLAPQPSTDHAQPAQPAQSVPRAPETITIPEQGNREPYSSPLRGVEDREGLLLAQARPPTEGASQTPTSTPPEQGAEPTRDREPKEKAPGEPGERTRGAGNLAELANALNGKGFLLYLLALSLLLIGVLYVSIQRVRREDETR